MSKWVNLNFCNNFLAFVPKRFTRYVHGNRNTIDNIKTLISGSPINLNSRKVFGLWEKIVPGKKTPRRDEENMRKLRIAIEHGSKTKPPCRYSPVILFSISGSTWLTISLSVCLSVYGNVCTGTPIKSFDPLTYLCSLLQQRHHHWRVPAAHGSVQGSHPTVVHMLDHRTVIHQELNLATKTETNDNTL